MEEIIPNKCYNCGKVFRDEHNFKRHKERKTACLIREIHENDLKNPNRCIYCNKILSKKEHLTRHHKTCKVKNGGLNVLYDKTRYEEQIRIIKEEKDQQINELQHKMQERDEMLQKLQEDHAKQMQEMMERMSRLEQHPPTVNNTVNNVNNNNLTIDNSVSIVINNYNTPNYKHLLEFERFREIFSRELHATPVEIALEVYFDPDHPENASIHLVDKETKHVIAMVNGKWNTIPLEKALKTIRDLGYRITKEGLSLCNTKSATEEQKQFINKFYHEYIEPLKDRKGNLDEERIDNGYIKQRLEDEMPNSALHTAVIMEKERIRQAMKAGRKKANK